MSQSAWARGEPRVMKSVPATSYHVDDIPATAGAGYPATCASGPGSTYRECYGLCHQTAGRVLHPRRDSGMIYWGLDDDIPPTPDGACPGPRWNRDCGRQPPPVHNIPFRVSRGVDGHLHP